MLKQTFIVIIVFLISFYSTVIYAEELPLIEPGFSLQSLQSQASEWMPNQEPAEEQPKRPIEPFGPIFDHHSSPFVGSNAMITILRGYQWADDSFLPTTVGDTGLGSRLGRAGKLLILEEIVFGTEMIVQHEVFGHGFRAREFGVKVNSYHITPWHGATYFNGAQLAQLSQHEKAAFATGGMEANGILARQLRARWLDSQVVDSRESHLYFLTSLDQTFYIYDNRNHDGTFPEGHDVGHYIQDVNNWYQSPVLNAHKLRRRAWIDFLDPYLFYSLYSMGSYVMEGEQYWEYPMITMGDYQYLPGLRLILAPYGVEYQFNNYFKGEYNIQAGLRFGNTGGRHSSGLSVEVSNLYQVEKLSFGGKLDLWDQPKMFAANIVSGTERFGIAGTVIARFKVTDKFDMVGQAGYKTTGYVPGEVLRHSPIVRIGFAAYL